MGLAVRTSPLISRDKPYPSDIGDAAKVLRSSRFPFSEPVARALENLQAGVTQLNAVLRQQAPAVQDIIVRDITGRIIAAIGEFETNGVQTSGGMFAELYAGFPYSISDPAQAIFSVTPDGAVRVGQSGWVDVLDPFGRDAAWIGTQYDTLPVTGAADNGSGLIRLTVTGHTLATGDVTPVLGIGGLVDGYGDSVAQGLFTVTKIDANHIDLQNSFFLGTYTSGGTVSRILHVTGAANNGSGLIRLTTAVAHSYINGEQVTVANVGGVANATGQWLVTVVDSTHIDLIGSAFAGAYTSGGTVLRYFAGGLFQTIAIGGTSFPTSKLRALANGDLRITDALIRLNGSGATITLDPTSGTISVVATSGNMATFVDLNGVTVFNKTGSAPGTFVQSNNITINGSVTQTGTNPATYSLAAGPQVTLLDNEIAIQNSGGTVAIDLRDDGTVTATGKIRSGAAGFSVNGTDGIDDASFQEINVAIGGGLTVNTNVTGLVGTPAAGQSNTPVVTSVSLNLIARTFTKGILSA